MGVLSRRAGQGASALLQSAVVAALAMMAAGCADRSRSTSPDAPSTVAVSAENVLANPGFEVDDPEFAPWFRNVHADFEAFTFTLDQAVVREGTRSLRIERVKPEPYAGIGQRFRKRDLAHGRYRLSAWVRGQELTGPVYLHGAFFAYGSPFAEVGDADAGKSGTFDWTRLALDIELPERFDQVEVGLATTGDGIVWVDAVELVPLGDDDPLVDSPVP